VRHEDAKPHDDTEEHNGDEEAKEKSALRLPQCAVLRDFILESL